MGAKEFLGLGLPEEKLPTLYRILSLGFFVNFCAVIAASTAEALFVSNVGAKSLPTVYMFLALSSVFVTFILTGVIDKFSRAKVFIFTLLTVSLLTVLCFILAQTKMIWPYYFIYIVLISTIIVFYTIFFTLIRDYLTSLDLKRSVSALVNSIAIGGIFGGIIVRLGSSFLKTDLIILIISFLSILGVFLVSYIDKTCKLIADTSNTKNEPESILQSFSVIKNITKKYVFIRNLFIISLIFYVLFNLSYYCTFSIYEKAFPSEGDLTRFLGTLRSVFSAVELIICISVVGFLINKTSTTTKNMVFPIINLVSFLGLLVFPFLPMAILSHSTSTVFWNSINSPINNLNYNAVPQRYMGRVHTITKGLIAPFAMALTGIFILIFQNQLPFGFFPFMGVLLSLTFMYYSYIIGKEYVPTIIGNLKDGLLCFDQDAPLLPYVQKNHAQDVFRMFKSKDLNEKRNALLLAPSLNPMDALAEIERIVKQDQTENGLIILEIFRNRKNKKTISLLMNWLESSDTGLQKMGLHLLTFFQIRVNETTLHKLFLSEYKEIKVLVVLAVMSTYEDTNYPPFVDPETSFDLIMQNKNFALSILKDIPDKKFIPLLIALLKEKDKMIKEEVLLILTKISPLEEPDLMPLLYQTLKNKDESVRIASLMVLGTIGSDQNLFLISNALLDKSLMVRLCAAKVLSQFKKRAIGIIAFHLFSLNQIDTPEATFEALGQMDIPEADKVLKLYLNKQYMQCDLNQQWLERIPKEDPDWELLRIALMDSNQKIFKNVFSIFSAFGYDKYVTIIQQAVLTNDERLKSNALESLMSLPKIDLVEPLEKLINYLNASPSTVAQTTKQMPSKSLSFLEVSMLNEALLSINQWIQLAALTVFIKKKKEIPEQIEPIYSPLALKALSTIGSTSFSKGDLLMDKIIFLKNIPIFHDMGLDDLLAIENYFIREDYVAGETIIKQGDIGTEFYIIFEGSVDVRLQHNETQAVVATLDSGEYFGEVALFDNQPRTATITARDNCILLRLDQKTFLNLAKQRPQFLLNICRVLSQRLRNTEEKLNLQS